MKRIKFVLLIVLGLILLVGCEEGASIKIINQTNHNVYAGVDGKEITVSGNSDYKINVDTDEKVFLFDDGKTNKTLEIVGETFRIWDDYTEDFFYETELKVTPGKTYNVYCSPNSASVKINNNSSQKITKLWYRKNSQFLTGTWFMVSYDPPIESNDFTFYHLLPQTEQNRFFYNFRVETESGGVYNYGNEFQGIELLMDEQFLIEIEGD